VQLKGHLKPSNPPLGSVLNSSAIGTNDFDLAKLGMREDARATLVTGPLYRVSLLVVVIPDHVARKPKDRSLASQVLVKGAFFSEEVVAGESPASNVLRGVTLKATPRNDAG
jgi:hypothetical protein